MIGDELPHPVGSTVAPASAGRASAGRRAGAALSLVVGVVSSTTLTRAERPRIAVEHARSDAAARRVFAEVRNAGLDPVDVHVTEHSTGVSALADRYRAIAVLSLKRPGRIELAVLSPDTREVIYESTVTSKGGTPASVRAAEELHGRLIDLPRRETPDTSAPPPEQTAPASAPTEPEHDATLAPQEVPSEKPVSFTRAASLDDRTRDTANDTSSRKDTNAKLDRAHFWAGAGAGASSGVGGG
ncbi:MAG TPA: hypothetical protein VHU80_16605, partial [Polyangiaceae bacterium]|nr:hypothetical protein [Polyangiaceae bacterium]